MFSRLASLAVVLTLASPLAALADERAGNTPGAETAAASTATDPGSTASMPAWAVDPIVKRPAALLALYGAYGTLQGLDVVSTRKAIANGAHETNPLMGGGGIGRAVIVKAATGAMSIYFAEKMWKKNRVGAVLVMAAINGTTAAVVARNTRLARR